MLKLRQKLMLTSIVLFFSISAFSQQALKINEIPYVPCDEMLAILDRVAQQLRKTPTSKLYVIYYEGKKTSVEVYNPKTQKYKEILENPRFGNALNRAKEIPRYLKIRFEFPINKVVLIDGGFRENFTMEIWIVPEEADIPKATPTLERKDVKLSKMKPQGVRNLAGCP